MTLEIFKANYSAVNTSKFTECFEKRYKNRQFRIYPV